MSERLDLFPTPVMKAVWPLANQQSGALIQAINDNRQQSGGVARSNIGGWHSNNDMAVWGGEAAIALASFATEIASPHIMDVHPKGKREFTWSVEMWAMINPPGAAHQSHCHPGALWSAIYFLDTGGFDPNIGGGEIVLEDPRYPTTHMTVSHLVMKMADGSPIHQNVAIRPEAGSLIVFPSWLRQSVTQHKGDRPSISIAMNLMVDLAT